MTEAEWLACEDPEAMHAIVAKGAFSRTGGYHSATKRKREFFSAACCRLAWPLIVADDRCRLAIEYLETQFDSPFSEEQVEDIWGAVKDAARHPEPETPVLQMCAANLVYDAEDTEVVIAYLTRSFDEWGDVKARAVQITRIMRDIVGNPFRPVAFDPEWRTSTVVALAQQMYESRDFGVMPILADALQDAGCDSGDVLDHCRGPGPHVRGCWVVDLVLGKE